ncbi:MAG: hypothetical protein Q9181_003355 [Wetmoreana brouardii]
MHIINGVLTEHSLSRPSFSEQTRLPEQSNDKESSIDPNASLDHNFHLTERFVFSPLLTLPPAFGSAYVGETFSCTLCANNELPDGADRRIHAVQIIAEMQAPTQSVPLNLIAAEEQEANFELKPAESLQKTIRFDLKEEGNHVLAISVNYTETRLDDNEISKARTRMFRKLYQFVAAPCLRVLTKVSDLPLHGVETEKRSNVKPLSFALEAQLENMADGPITLEEVAFSPKPSFNTTSINWDVSWPYHQKMECPFLTPRDVMQVAFLIKQQLKPSVEVTRDGRVLLGQLTIRWRTAMGDSGFLTTGWLTTRKRP